MQSNLWLLALAVILGLSACTGTYTAPAGGSDEAVGPADFGDDDGGGY